MAKPKPRQDRKADNVKKWHTLKHKGPQFHPPYKRLGIHLFKYNKRIIQLTKPSEEVVVMYAKYLMNKNRARKGQAILRKNFFEDWRNHYMSAAERRLIQNFSYCDFALIVNHLKQLSETRKFMSQRQKEKNKELKEQYKRKYQYVFINGKKEQVSNFMVEPPGLFLGRGANLNIGRIKARIEPENVIINCSQNCRPRPPKGRQWMEKICDQTKSWLACYKESVTGKMKYIFPHASSRIKSQSEQEKYSKAEELTRKITGIRRRYRKDLESDFLQTRQHATAVFFLDQFALRVGTEKNEGDADTVGCCTLRVEHVTLLKPIKNREIKLTFLGKDSVPYLENLQEFLKEKRKVGLIFHEITAKSLNEYLGGMMEGLTAKVFRTFQATQNYQMNIKYFSRNLRRDSSGTEKRLAHLKANLEVAKLLNHVTMAVNTKKTKEKGLLKQEEKVKRMQNDFRVVMRKRPKRGSEEFEEKEETKRKLQILEDELFIKTARVEWSLQTSLANYIDPRAVRQWCNSYKIDVNLVYTKSLRDKFRWALEGRQKPVFKTKRRPVNARIKFGNSGIQHRQRR